MRTALVVDLWMPTPDRDTASMRMVHLMKLLRERVDTVIFAAEDPATYGRPSSRLLRENHITLLPDVFSGSLDAFLEAHGESLDLVILSRLEVATRTMEVVRTLAPRAAIIYDTVDLHFVRRFRAAKLTGSLPMLKAAIEAKQEELAIVRSVDRVLAVSPDEIAVLARECPEAQVSLLSVIQEVHQPVRRYDEREGILFIGAFPFHPNVDAMEYYDDEIRPFLASRLPSVVTTLIGSSPPESLRKRASDTFVVTGYVPDVTPYFESNRLSIAPIRYGAGVKGKVLLSMSYGVPVVGTTIAAEGILSAGDGLLIADEPRAFADAIVELYLDQDRWQRLSSDGLRLVEKHFSVETARRQLAEVLLSLDRVAGERAQ